MQDPIQVEKFFRASITVSAITFVAMITAVGLGYWSLLPGAIASLGVVASFGVHLNTLINRFGLLERAGASDEPVPYPN